MNTFQKRKNLMQTPKGGMVRAITSLAAVGPGTFATVQKPFWYDWPHIRPCIPQPGESSKGTGNPQGIWLWRSSELDYRTSTGLGKTKTLGGHRQSLCTQDPEERSSGPTRDWADLPVSVWGSPAEVWVHCGPPRVWSTGNSSPGRCSVLASVLLEEVPISIAIEPPGGQSTNGRSYQVGEGQWQK